MADKILENEEKNDELIDTQADQSAQDLLNPKIISPYFKIWPSGDIKLGNYDCGTGLFWNQSTGTFFVKGNSVSALTIDYGGSALFKKGGNINFSSVVAPTACVATLVSTAIGNLDNGTYSYKITFVNSTGETELGTESNSVTVDNTHKQVSLSSIPVSSSGGVTSRNIYRTKASSAGVYYLLDTVAGNSTTTYTDNIADASLPIIPADSRGNDTFGKILVDGTEVISLSVENIFIGKQCGYSNTVGFSNTAVGIDALYTNTYGVANTAIGRMALRFTTSDNNTAVGRNALYTDTTGGYNSAFGHSALQSITTGFGNSALGYNAGTSLTTGDYNTFVGYGTSTSKVNATNSSAIGNGASITASNQVVLGNSSVTETLLRGNIKIGGTAARATTAGTKAIHIFDGTAPVGTLTNGCSIYSTTGELYTMDSAGNTTLQTPHNNNNEWIFYSKNTVTGKILQIDMEKMMRKLNKKFGWDFIHDLIV